MARKPRVEFDGAFYHVIVRGNQRQDIFRDDRDRAVYLDKVERYRAQYGLRLYAYVLMSNHVHLLLQTGATPLSKIMQAIQFTYTQSYNRRHRTVGHLFQGRYKAILCDRDAYLLELVRYIHLNPARLRQPRDFHKYPWSSHQAYLGKKTPAAVETGLMLRQLGNGPARARRAYRAFIAAGVGIGIGRATMIRSISDFWATKILSRGWRSGPRGPRSCREVRESALSLWSKR